MTRRRHNSGFTLMEVVVAISLMSLVLLTLFMGIRIAVNAWHRGEQKLDEHARAITGTDVIEQQVAGAAVRIVTETKPDNSSEQVVAFSGTPSELRFCTNASWRGDRSRPQYMADYRVVRTPDGHQQLAISELGLTDDASVIRLLHQPEFGERSEAVGDPADQIEFAYYQPAGFDTPAKWVSAWKPISDSELPRAVRVQWTRGRELQQTTFMVTINHPPKGQ